jgi:glycosyltransferase involved in cell wall biosynthesis
MRVLNVNTCLDVATGAGTAERTFQMSRFLARNGVQCTVLTLDLGLDEGRVAALAPARVVAVPCIWKRFYVPRLRWKTVRSLVAEADIIHLMNHWTLLNALVYLAARLSRKPYVVCPAGGAILYGRSRTAKRLYNFVVGNAIIRNASACIAVTDSEYSHFQSYGVPVSQVAVIPNGVCEDDFPLTDGKSFRARYGLSDAPIILFMGRLNPIKGPDLLLDAFISIGNRFPEHQLVFGGMDEGMLSGLRRAADQGGIGGRTHFLGNLNGSDRPAAYRVAKLLVVPSRREAMSIVALEAGICGTAVLVTDQCGFSEIRSVDPRMEVPATAAGIAEGLVRLLSDPGALERIAPAWRDFAHLKYGWNVVVRRYLELYRDILSRQQEPF